MSTPHAFLLVITGCSVCLVASGKEVSSDRCDGDESISLLQVRQDEVSSEDAPTLPYLHMEGMDMRPAQQVMQNQWMQALVQQRSPISEPQVMHNSGQDIALVQQRGLISEAQALHTSGQDISLGSQLDDSLATTKQQLQEEREKVRELEEYVRLADSNNKKLAALEEQHAQEIAQYRFQNQRLQSELRAIRERCKNEIEQVVADRGNTYALYSHYSESLPGCLSIDKNGAQPVTDSRSCDDACSKLVGIECYKKGCRYKGRHNSSFCACPVVDLLGVEVSSRNLCQDQDFKHDAELDMKGTTPSAIRLSLLVVLGVCLSL
jgi:hypothetical protein